MGRLFQVATALDLPKLSPFALKATNAPPQKLYHSTLIQKIAIQLPLYQNHVTTLNVFISTLPLWERQAGGAWEPSNKIMFSLALLPINKVSSSLLPRLLAVSYSSATVSPLSLFRIRGLLISLYEFVVRLVSRRKQEASRDVVKGRGESWWEGRGTRTRTTAS